MGTNKEDKGTGDTRSGTDGSRGEVQPSELSYLDKYKLRRALSSYDKIAHRIEKWKKKLEKNYSERNQRKLEKFRGQAILALIKSKELVNIVDYDKGGAEVTEEGLREMSLDDLMDTMEMVINEMRRLV